EALFVANIHGYTGAKDMRNLTVADIHTYYVIAGNTPVLVHNCGGSVPGHPDTCTCGGDAIPTNSAADSYPQWTDPRTGIPFPTLGTDWKWLRRQTGSLGATRNAGRLLRSGTTGASRNPTETGRTTTFTTSSRVNTVARTTSTIWCRFFAKITRTILLGGGTISQGRRTVSTQMNAFRTWVFPEGGVGGDPFKLRCFVSEPASFEEIQAAWVGRQLDPRAVDLWRDCREARLFEDVEYGQWGLHLFTPSESAERTAVELNRRPVDIRDSDVVLG